MTMKNSPIIFCAIDTNDLDRAINLASQIAPVTGGIKLGLEFFNANGLEGVKRVLDSAPDAKLFLDLKLHDIPNTVARAVKSICDSVTPAFLNVHASGGSEMMKAARQACPQSVKMLSVTLLTSLDESAIKEIGFCSGIAARVEQLALLSKNSDMDGVVCSAHEIKALRKSCGDDFTLMVPGIRPKGANKGDQKRVMTPEKALAAGANHLVIGRPITGSSDPARAAQDILDSL